MLPVKHTATGLERRQRETRAPAQAILWRHLRRNRLLGRTFRRWHSIGPYVVDFYCPEERLGVELDSEIDGSPHGHGAAVRRDVFRTTYLAAAGVRVIRFAYHDIVRDPAGVLASIERCFATRGTRVHVLRDDEEC
jgi:very-short-patch-repair endonuclease